MSACVSGLCLKLFKIAFEKLQGFNRVSVTTGKKNQKLIVEMVSCLHIDMRTYCGCGRAIDDYISRVCQWAFS